MRQVCWNHMERRRNGILIFSHTAGRKGGLEVGYIFFSFPWQEGCKACKPFYLWGVGGLLWNTSFSSFSQSLRNQCLRWLDAELRGRSHQSLKLRPAVPRPPTSSTGESRLCPLTPWGTAAVSVLSAPPFLVSEMGLNHGIPCLEGEGSNSSLY